MFFNTLLEFVIDVFGWILGLLVDLMEHDLDSLWELRAPIKL
jgi:hypothetical protein